MQVRQTSKVACPPTENRASTLPDCLVAPQYAFLSLFLCSRASSALPLCHPLPAIRSLPLPLYSSPSSLSSPHLHIYNRDACKTLAPQKDPVRKTLAPRKDPGTSERPWHLRKNHRAH
eukprot:351297-Chlamydomonas_euryale.AAC.7